MQGKVFVVGSKRPARATRWTAIAMMHAAGALQTAQTRADTASAAGENALEEVIVTGTRESGIRAADSAAPIQIISAAALKNAGAADLMSALVTLVPSLQMLAFGNDMAGQTLQARLRGVSPNDVLVLINGKRRHTTANLAVDLGSPYQGGAGVDLNFIPLDAIDHVEVLTEGAAAQYGSDAIAGVINIVLKKNSTGGSLTGTYGQYGNDGGGKTEDVSGNVGLEPGPDSYFNITGEFRDHGHSNSGAIDPRLLPANLAAEGYPDTNAANVPGYPNLNRIFGDAAVQQKILSLNAGWVIDGGTELYFVATYGRKYAASYENYRVPSKAAYTDTATGVTTYSQPNGFSPQEADDEGDYQYGGGIKGVFGGWNWDLGTGFGRDHDSLYTLSTLNTGYYGDTGDAAAGMLNDIYDGYLQATQWTSTADVQRNFDLGFGSPLNAAFGVEHRRDTYSIGAGPPISYIDGGGSSYPGFTPLDASSHARTNDAGYIDFSTKPLGALRIDAAVRFEHYSDFGNATVGKLSARYDFSPQLALRANVSNGFRAPTLAEEYFSSTNVGVAAAYVQLPPNSPAGKLLGLGNGLQPEKSLDFSTGLVWRPTERMNTTLDVYQISITNRIVGSGDLAGQINGVPTAAFAGVGSAIASYSHGSDVIDPAILGTCPPGPSLSIICGSYGINVFANGIGTRTRGADLAFNFPYDYSFGEIDWSVSSAYNSTVITKYAATPALLAGATLYDAEAYSALQTTNPKYEINLGGLFILGRLSVNLVEKVYGPSSEYQTDDGDNGPGTPYSVCSYGTCNGNFSYYQDKIGVTLITNLDVGYQFTEALKLSIGAQNLFNKFPNKLNSNVLAREKTAVDNAAVEQYPAFSPFGINGGFYYVKAAYNF